MLPMTIRATALVATLDALQSAPDEPMQVELLKIAREQAAALRGQEADDSSDPQPAIQARHTMATIVVQFRRHAKMSTSSASS